MIKTYFNLIVGIVLIVIFAAASITINVLKAQRDKARLERDNALLLVKDYKRVSDEAAKRSAELMVLAASHDVANAEVIARLKAEVAKSDEEARLLAIAAGQAIGGLV